MQIYEVKILDIIDESNYVKTFKLEKPEGLKWKPSAMIHIGLVEFDQADEPNKALVRHMTAHNLDISDTVDFTTDFSGDKSLYKEELSKLIVGDSVKLFKIVEFIDLDRLGGDIVLLSNGLSMAGSKGLIEAYLADKTGIKSMTSINLDLDGLALYNQDLEDEDLKLVYSPTKESFKEDLNQYISNDSIVYLFGDDEFTNKVLSILKERDFDLEQVVLNTIPERAEEIKSKIV